MTCLTPSPPTTPLTSFVSPSTRIVHLRLHFQCPILAPTSPQQLVGRFRDLAWVRAVTKSLVPHLKRSLSAPIDIDIDAACLRPLAPCNHSSVCAVCLDTVYFDGAIETRCGHIFHTHCIHPWLRQHPTCPVCRTALVRRPPLPHFRLLQIRTRVGTITIPTDKPLVVAVDVALERLPEGSKSSKHRCQVLVELATSKSPKKRPGTDSGNRSPKRHTPMSET
ncbi:Aste57867_18243 [Aphanomyces stellatus]|uniref:Aste57867_18243 protein n=1 Tax=Aphanomyces stellatus TaxID=120398 RepID=A0A485L9V2_9STRA|nr:hypothetical protein As57867_018181 [Aphanomyces stellatus]VFT94980.1 Aste57867_18243 [Aphanomyces stellatus]